MGKGAKSPISRCCIQPRDFLLPQVEHLIGLDRCYQILSWPTGDLDLLRRSMQMQVPVGFARRLRTRAHARRAPRTGIIRPQSGRKEIAGEPRKLRAILHFLSGGREASAERA